MPESRVDSSTYRDTATLKVLTHRLHTFRYDFQRLKDEPLCAEQMSEKLLCVATSHAHLECVEARYVFSVKRVDRSHRSVRQNRYFFGPVAQRLVQGTHSESCATRMETSCGMVSKSANSKRSDAYDNAEPSKVTNFEGVET